MRVLLGIVAFLFLIPAYTQGQDFSGRVIGITDGDTLTVLNGSREQVTTRLAEIDAPEGGQPYGNRSRQVLSELAFGKDVLVRYFDTDAYGRTVTRLDAAMSIFLPR
jgi:micrococcal nuclease